MKSILKKDNLFTLAFVLIVLHPLYELDYLFGSFFDSVGLFRPTTLINFVILPLIVLAIFYLYEKNKKRILLIIGIYFVLLVAYFIPHCNNAFYIQDNTHLGYTFYFTVKDEIFYVITLLLPLGYVYALNYADINESIMQKITTCMSFVISIPIVISNFFQFGYTTYMDVMKGSFFDWFSLPYNDKINHPRRYATKFFFQEGNTIGIILVMILPFMYYFLLREKDIKKKIFIGLLILTDSLAMLMLGTRVASYCTVLIPIAVICVYVFTWLIKTENIKKGFIIFCIILTIINARIIPVCPAYQNQQFDASDFSTLKLDDSIREGYRRGISEGAEGMEPFGPEWIDYYCYMFMQYKFLIGVTPSVYYEYFYDYRVDPKFWVDLIFDYELEERVNARQLETIFYKYKWDLLTPAQKLTGISWSLFMWGGINIERDFILQFYSFGYLGFPLIMGPWIILLLYVLYKFLISFKNGKWNFFNITILMSIALGIATSITSGHGIDQLSSSLFIALCCALLIKNTRSNNEQA